MTEAPICSKPDCGKPAQNTGHKDKHGNIRWRKIKPFKEKYGGEGYACGKCHVDAICEKRGISNRELTIEMMETAATKRGMTVPEYIRFQNGKDTEWYEQGYESYSDYKENFLDLYSWKSFKEDHCENIGGLLPFPCVTIVIDQNDLGINHLEQDHLDGNPSNECEANSLTLCHECHKLKSRICGDSQTPGRKTLGLIK